jgi:hypothetical protein
MAIRLGVSLDDAADGQVQMAAGAQRAEQVVAADGQRHQDAGIIGVVAQTSQFLRGDVIDRRPVLRQIQESHSG